MSASPPGGHSNKESNWDASHIVNHLVPKEQESRDGEVASSSYDHQPYTFSTTEMAENNNNTSSPAADHVETLLSTIFSLIPPPGGMMPEMKDSSTQNAHREKRSEEEGKRSADVLAGHTSPEGLHGEQQNRHGHHHNNNSTSGHNPERAKDVDPLCGSVLVTDHNSPVGKAEDTSHPNDASGRHVKENISQGEGLAPRMLSGSSSRFPRSRRVSFTESNNNPLHCNISNSVPNLPTTHTPQKSSHSIMMDCHISSLDNDTNENSGALTMQSLSERNVTFTRRRSTGPTPEGSEANAELEDYEDSLKLIEIRDVGGNLTVTSSPLKLPRVRNSAQLISADSPSFRARNDYSATMTGGEATATSGLTNRSASAGRAFGPGTGSWTGNVVHDGRGEREENVVASPLIRAEHPEEVEGRAEGGGGGEGSHSQENDRSGDAEEGRDLMTEGTSRFIPTGWGVGFRPRRANPLRRSSSSSYHVSEDDPFGVQNANNTHRGQHSVRALRGDVKKPKQRRDRITSQELKMLEKFHGMPRQTAHAPLRLLHAIILQEYLSFKQKIYQCSCFHFSRRNKYLKNHIEGEIKWGKNIWEDTMVWGQLPEDAFHHHYINKDIRQSVGDMRTSGIGALPTSAPTAGSSVSNTGVFGNIGSTSKVGVPLEGVQLPTILDFSSSSAQHPPVNGSYNADCSIPNGSTLDNVQLSPRGREQDSFPEFCERDKFLSRDMIENSPCISLHGSSPLYFYQSRGRSVVNESTMDTIPLSQILRLNCHHFLYRCCCIRCAIAQQTSLVFLDGERQHLVPIPFLFPKLYPHPMQYSRAVWAMGCIDGLTCGFCCPCIGYNGVGTALFGWRLRYWVRCRYGLYGTSMKDLFTMLLCPSLASDQIGFELESRGLHEQWTPFVSSTLNNLDDLYRIR